MVGANPEAVIETRGLRRVFKSRQRQVEAVVGGDLHVSAGENFGFLGPHRARQPTHLPLPATPLPQSRARVWDEVRRMHDRGTTVFLTTHYLDEADALCDRVAIIDYGKIVAEGTPEELKRAIAGDVVTFSVAGEQRRALDLIQGEPFVREARLENGSVHLYVDRGEQAMPAILRLLDGANLQLPTGALHRPSLDDVFLRQTGRSLRESPA